MWDWEGKPGQGGEGSTRKKGMRDIKQREKGSPSSPDDGFLVLDFG